MSRIEKMFCFLIVLLSLYLVFDLLIEKDKQQKQTTPLEPITNPFKIHRV